MSKIEFKEFVKKNPNLIDVVKNGKKTWQDLYELYDLYGEENSIWNKYLNNNIDSNHNSENIGSSFKELLNLIRGIDLNTVQKGLSSLDKAIDAFKDIIPSTNKVENINNYESRPTYKYFED